MLNPFAARYNELQSRRASGALDDDAFSLELGYLVGEAYRSVLDARFYVVAVSMTLLGGLLGGAAGVVLAIAITTGSQSILLVGVVTMAGLACGGLIGVASEHDRIQAKAWAVLKSDGDPKVLTQPDDDTPAA